jgi:hypothetical protein
VLPGSIVAPGPLDAVEAVAAMPVAPGAEEEPDGDPVQAATRATSATRSNRRMPSIMRPTRDVPMRFPRQAK